MKKTLVLLSTIAMALTLSACSDATANISNGSETLISVGNEKVTKEDVYQSLKSNIGSAALNQLKLEVFKKEGIKETDEIKKQADEKLAQIKEQWGENYEKQLKSEGFANDQELKEAYILPALYQTELQKKYVTENKDKLFTSYTPYKAQIFQASDEGKANDALKALKNGDKFSDVVKKYGTTTTYDGSEKVYTNQSGLPDEVFSALSSAGKKGLVEKVITSTDSSTSVTSYYIVNMIDTEPKNYEDAAIQAIAETSTIATEATKFYFKKYDMTIYDIDAYNSLKNSDLIVQ